MPHPSYTLPRDLAAALARYPDSAVHLQRWDRSGNPAQAAASLRKAGSCLLSHEGATGPSAAEREEVGRMLADLEALRTWWSGLPAEVLEIVGQVERGEAPDPWRLTLVRSAALRAEHGQAPSRPGRIHWDGMMSPADRVSVAHDLLSIVQRAEGLIQVRHARSSETTNQNGRTK